MEYSILAESFEKMETTRKRLVKGIEKANRKSLKLIYNKLIPGLF